MAAVIYRNPENVHQPVAGYTHQIEVREPARWLVLSGQIGMRPDGSVPADPVEQIEVALENLRRNLDAAGMGVRDVVKLTFLLVGENEEGEPARRRAAFDSWLGDHKPAMTLLYVSRLASPALRVEIDAWACQDNGDS
ncbi:RidA family protein [Streptomyces sp. LS1784]|uniref:RidA family protein n=1 Tax=Streptomyces sp. LS1784 TaxID=2851533 RepID=UPI001CCC7887|nr:RidA family protein [Streptomyces sp. LS1784]